MNVYYGSILFGITLGFTSLIPLTAFNNHLSESKCADLSNTHTLIHVRAFAGDAYHCIDNRYL